MMLYRPAEGRDVIAVPLFSDRVPCGFPSPATDYVEQRIDLNELLVQFDLFCENGWRLDDRRRD